MNHWEPLLEEWLLLIERYCRISKGEEAPYEYKERAHIGLLAGAAWRSGKISLEEFSIEKGYRNKPKWTGRADLYIGHEDRNEFIEAKFKWLSFRGEIQNLVKKTINYAIDDARKTRGHKNNPPCIAVAFLPVYLPKKYGNKLDEYISDSIVKITELNYHAIAWCFPKEMRKAREEYKNIIPGTFIVAVNPDHL